MPTFTNIRITLWGQINRFRMSTNTSEIRLQQVKSLLLFTHTWRRSQFVALSCFFSGSCCLFSSILSSLQRQWCDVCRSEHSSSLPSHLSSTLHQFNLRRPPPTPYYCLPPSSNSFKMMVRCGWKPGTGLGPQGEGPKQPVPTVLKRDQKGLGYGQMKRAKVTHFQARDCEAVKPPSKDKVGIGMKGQRKEESRKKEQKDRNWERDFRASFYLWHWLIHICIWNT